MKVKDLAGLFIMNCKNGYGDFDVCVKGKIGSEDVIGWSLFEEGKEIQLRIGKCEIFLPAKIEQKLEDIQEEIYSALKANEGKYVNFKICDLYNFQHFVDFVFKGKFQDAYDLFIKMNKDITESIPLFIYDYICEKNKGL